MKTGAANTKDLAPERRARKNRTSLQENTQKTKIGAAPHRGGSFSVWRRGCAVSRQRCAARKNRCAARKNRRIFHTGQDVRTFSGNSGGKKTPTVSHKNPGGFSPRTRFRPLFCLRCDPSFPGVFLFSRFQSRGANSRTARCRIRSGSVSSASFGRISRHSGKSARMLSRTESTVGDPYIQTASSKW